MVERGFGWMRCNDMMAHICKGGHDAWHNYCPIQDAFHRALPAVIERAGLENKI